MGTLEGVIGDTAGFAAAKWFVEMSGGKVIPAYINKEAEKYPLLKGWQNNGSREEEVLHEWFNERYRYAWVGGLTGRDSGLLVFDCDGPEAVGRFRELTSSIGWTGEGCFFYRTPGRRDEKDTHGGAHFWYRWPSWLASFHKSEIREPGWRGGLELRAEGCWTMIAGAKRPDGEYEVLGVPDKLEELPRELWLAFLENAETAIGSGAGDSDLRSLSPEEAWEQAPWFDGRKGAVAGIAWYMSIRGHTEEEVVSECCRFALEACEPSLDKTAAERRARYAYGRATSVLAKQDAELKRMHDATELWRKRR